MRVLVTGAGGMLAGAVMAEAGSRGHDVIGLSHQELDVTDGQATHAAVDRHRPHAVIQCAAFTAVDDAEAREDEALRVNGLGSRNMALACDATGARFVYPGTDYVFSGESTSPYRPDDPTGPLNAYGRSKLAGEEAAKLASRFLVVRTSWLYGPGGPNFVETMLRLAARGEVRVVADQHGRPTSSATLAVAILELLEKGVDGTFHATDGGPPTTWYGFAKEILEGVGAGHNLTPVATGEFPRPARRPAYSVLDVSTTEAVLGRMMPDWRGSLREYLLATGRRTTSADAGLATLDVI